MTNSTPTGEVFVWNGRVQDDYIFTVLPNPLILLNPNITIVGTHFNFQDPMSAANYVWLNCIGFYVMYQVRVGIVNLFSRAYSGYYPVDRVRDSNVPISARNIGNFFVFTVVDNTIERQNVFQAIASAITGVRSNEIRNLAALSSFTDTIPIN
jgi:hypothetical protein